MTRSGLCTRSLLALLAAFLLAPALAPAVNDPVDDVDRAFASGRFGDMALLLEPQLRELKNGKSDQLVRLCFAYSKIKSYAKLEACLDALEKTIAGGDRSGGKYGSWWAQPTWFVTSRMPSGLMFGTKDWDITPYPPIMRAEAALDHGDYPRAIAQALIAKGKLTSNQTQGNYFQIDVLGILAIGHALLGQPEQARVFIAELSKLNISSFATSSAEIYFRATLARALVAVKDFPRALEIISHDTSSGLRAMASGFAGLKDGESLWRWEEAPRDYMRHKCEMETDRRKEAKAGFDRLLAQPGIADHAGFFWMLLHDRGRLAERDGDTGAAIRYYGAAVDAIERLRASINTEASRIGFIADKQEVYFDLIRLLVAGGNVASAFEYVERAKSRALVDLLASKQMFSARDIDAETARQVLRTLDAADLEARIQADTARPGAVTRLRSLELARQDVRLKAPELSSLVTVTSVPTNELRALIGADETLVEYYYWGRELYIFLLDRAQLQVVTLDATGLGDAVHAFRTAVVDPATSNWQISAKALYQRLWAPIEKHVTSQSVVVVAHGALHYLPFSSLQAPDGRLLIDQVGLRFLPSASVLKFLRPTIDRNAVKLLALGNPDLGDARLDLKYAEAEARTVANLFPGSTLLVRREASATNFLKSAGLFSRVHFATHGSFRSDDPLNSGLRLAKDDENDGLLSVSGLYSLSLDADLIALSACETGLGAVSNGDDVVGLTRGFLYAGSRSIVASLWSVEDRATAALMKDFYTNLATQTKLDALRQAQITTRQKFPHPFFWAAFQLTGRSE